MSLKTVDTDAGKQAGAIVEEFLRIIMIPDPVGARAFTAPDMQIHFTGGRPMRDPGESSA